MVKIWLYSQDGKYMRDWKAHWYEWVGDYTGIQFAIPNTVGKDGETKIIVKGGIVIIEELNEEQN